MSAHRCIRCKAEKKPDLWYWYEWLPHPDEPEGSQYWVLCDKCQDELVRQGFMREGGVSDPRKSDLETVTLSEEQFQTLNGAGFFTMILDHPQVQLYSADGTICVHIPGRGLVQIAVRK